MNLRIVMTDADTEKLHRRTNVMSNDRLGCTIIVDEREVYYNCGVRLKGVSMAAQRMFGRVSFYAFPQINPFWGHIGRWPLIDRVQVTSSVKRKSWSSTRSITPETFPACMMI